VPYLVALLGEGCARGGDAQMLGQRGGTWWREEAAGGGADLEDDLLFA